MSKELIPCPYCGDKAEIVRNFGRIGIACVQCNANFRSESICSETGYDSIFAAWNQRFVCLDKNEDPVFSDSIITGWRGDHEVDECRLQFKEFCWWATEVQATFGVTPAYRLNDFDEIELVKEAK